MITKNQNLLDLFLSNFLKLNVIMFKELQAELHEKIHLIESFTNTGNYAKEISNISDMKLII